MIDKLKVGDKLKNPETGEVTEITRIVSLADPWIFEHTMCHTQEWFNGWEKMEEEK